jgi:Ca2+-binding RTX toxin-like protein
VSAAQITGANFTTFAPGPQAADDGARHDLTGSASPRGRDGAAPEAAPLVWNGTALNDRYRAGAVDDALNGLAGNDTLDGGFGDDILAGGTGDDVLFGGGGNDTASYEAALAGVTVNLNLIIPQATGGDGTDRLSGIENLLGSAFGDMLIGGDLSNLIEGGQGSDILSGEFGADVIFGGSRSGPADLSSNRLYGGHGQDVLHAGDGGDLLDGGISDDILVAGGGADLFVSADGKDTVVGFDVSEDRLFISAPYVVEAAGSDTLVWIGRDHFLLLDVQADQLTAANFFSEEPYPPTAPEPYILYNPIIGNETDETLTGGALGDHIEGLFGDDLLIGGRGDDWLEGFYGDDILRGDAGADILQGGRGNNILTGGAGADTFRVTYEVGYDTVMDFKVGEDVIDATQYGSFISIQKQGKSSLIVFASDRMMLLKNVSPDKLSYSDFIGLYELRGFEGISGAAQPGVAPATRHDPARLGPDTALHEGHFAPVVAVPAYTALGDGLWMME